MKRFMLVFTLLGAACGKRGNLTGPAPTGLLATVVGSWTLTQGCGGIAYHCTGAGSLSVPNLVVFYSNGTTDLFRAGVKVSSGTFTITPSATDSLRAGTIVMTPGLETATDTLTLNFSIEGELLLAEPCCDRLTYSFFKANAPD
jgi:hypothetical protein